MFFLRDMVENIGDGFLDIYTTQDNLISTLSRMGVRGDSAALAARIRAPGHSHMSSACIRP